MSVVLSCVVYPYRGHNANMKATFLRLPTITVLIPDHLLQLLLPLLTLCPLVVVRDFEMLYLEPGYIFCSVQSVKDLIK